MRQNSRLQTSIARLTRTPITLWVALYCAVLVFIYQNSAVKLLEYDGFYSYDYSPASWVLRVVLAYVPLRLLSRETQRLSTSVLWLMYVVLYIPCQLFVGHMTEFAYASALFFRFLTCGCFCLTVTLVARNNSSRFPGHARKSQIRTTLSPRMFWNYVIALAGLLYGGIIMVYGLRFRLLSLEEVYMVRAEFTRASGSIGVLGPYLVCWTAKVMNPLLLYIGLSSKRFGLIALALTGQLLVFSVTGFKESVGIMFMSTGLWAIQKTPFSKNIGKSFLIGLTTVFSALYAIDTFIGNEWPTFTMIVTRRMTFVPAKLTAYYYDFFSAHDVYLLSHSVLKWLFTMPHDLVPPYLIGQNYALSATASLNANYLADGAANFGWPGVILASVALGLILRLCDNHIPDTARGTATVVLTIPAFSLTNSGLLTSLVTHGIGLALILLALLPPEVLRPRR